MGDRHIGNTPFSRRYWLIEYVSALKGESGWLNAIQALDEVRTSIGGYKHDDAGVAVPENV